MTEGHARFRKDLAGHLAEVLPAEADSWMEAHARECSACAELRERVRDLLPALADEGGHAPVSVLERWVRSPDSFTPLEAKLMERHLASCATCREDADELALLAGVVRPIAGPKDWWQRWRKPVTAGLVAAAGLVAVFAIRLLTPPETSAPGVSPAPAPDPQHTRGEMMPLSGSTTIIELVEPVRGTTRGRAPEAMAPSRDGTLRLRLPALFLDGGEEVRLHLLDESGVPVWQAAVPRKALSDDITPTPPAGGWAPGRYRLLVIPQSMDGTGATREFAFTLVAPGPH